LSGLTYQTLLDDASKRLYDQSDTPRIDAEVLLQHVVERPLAWLIAHGSNKATEQHINDFNRLVETRQTGQPIAYLTGHKEFWSLDLLVNDSVLIPRPDTETLVEAALEKLTDNSASRVLDLGTGSGAIALAIAKERPLSDVLAVDFEAEALVVARKNATMNTINNVRFAQSDWFNAISHEPKFDLICTNPPYIEAGDPHLQQGDLRFEPDSALIATDNGLSDLRTIINMAPDYLTNDGWLLLEHGFDQAAPVAALLRDAGFIDIEHHKDINGLNRCTGGKRVR